MTAFTLFLILSLMGNVGLYAENQQLRDQVKQEQVEN